MKIPVVKILPVKKIPDILFYHPQNTNSYYMISVKQRMNAGYMNALPVILNGTKTFYINWLLIYKKRQDFGTKFLDFAVNLSKQYGCKGNLMLKASTTVFDPHNPPHIFYRKYGFTCADKKFLKKMDKCIRNKKQLNYRHTPSVDMFYPDVCNKKSFLQRLKDKFKN